MLGIAVIAILILAASAASKPDTEPAPEAEPQGPVQVSQIVGEVYTADVLPLEVVAGQIGDRFHWFVFRAQDVADDPKETTAPPIGRGDEGSPEKALASGVAFAEGLPPFPAPLGGEEGGPGTQAEGVRINQECTEIGVYDLSTWIAAAAPIVRESGSTDADTLMRKAFFAVFPGCGIEDGNSPEVRGQTWDATKTRVQNVIDKAQAGLFLDPAPTEEVLAARIVGMSVPSVPGASAINHVGAKNGNLHTIVIRPFGNDGFFRYWVWQGPRTDYASALFSGTRPTKTAARNEAKSKADNYLNFGTNLG